MQRKVVEDLLFIHFAETKLVRHANASFSRKSSQATLSLYKTFFMQKNLNLRVREMLES